MQFAGMSVDQEPACEPVLPSGLSSMDRVYRTLRMAVVDDQNAWRFFPKGITRLEDSFMNLRTSSH